MKAMTASPGANAATPGPTASTTPAISLPGTSTRGRARPGGVAPRRAAASAGCTPAAITRIRTSPAPGSGVGTSLSDRTSGGPASVTVIARIESLLGRGPVIAEHDATSSRLEVKPGARKALRSSLLACNSATWRRGEVANAAVCKTVIRGFDSRRRLSDCSRDPGS